MAQRGRTFSGQLVPATTGGGIALSENLQICNFEICHAVLAEPAMNLGGSFDHDADGNIFKASFGGGFGSISFGTAAQAELSQEFLLSDLTAIGSLSGGGPLGEVDLIYLPVPEPSTLVLAVVVLLAVILGDRRKLRP